MNKEVKFTTTDNWENVLRLKDSSLSLPKYVGNWEVGKGSGLHFSTFKKPNWFHRKITHLILGWIWIDG